MPGPAASGEPAPVLTLGRVAGLYGVRGWVKVYSYSRPPEAILNYTPWLLCRSGRWEPVHVAERRLAGRQVLARLEGVEDRDQARELLGRDIGIRLDQLPPLPEGEYYWVQLIGLRVRNLAGAELGRVDHLLETGANDVLVVLGERERLIPYIPQVVREVDLERGVLQVDWDPDF